MNNSMKKQEIPIIVAETLREVSEKVKEFNKTSDFKLVAKCSDEFLLKIYPKGYEDLHLTVIGFGLQKKNKNSNIHDIVFSIFVNYDSFELEEDLFFDVFEINTYKFKTTSQILIGVLNLYLSDITLLYSKIITYEKTPLDLSEIFDIEEEEEPISIEPNHFEEADKILPYSLKQLAVKGFQGIKDLSMESIPVDTQWIFLVGENGFGKTTILQSIFLGLNGAFDGNFNLLEDKHSSIQVEYKNLQDSFVNNAKTNEKRLVHLAAYGPGRLNLQGAKSENVEDRNNSISYNLFNSDGFLFNINADLTNFEARDKKRFALLKKTICTLIPNIADIKFNKETNQIEYIEQELNADGEKSVRYKPLPFKKLASGFKSIIALAGDIIVRLSKTQPTVKDPAELKGIVLIDEIDLHLHPKLQKQLVGQFSKVFPKIQFIVSTHSPIPLLGAASNTVILKVNRTEAEGIKVENVKIDLKNLTPNLVLTSGIFDMEDFVSAQNENLAEVRTEDSYAEMQKNDQVEQYLKHFEESSQSFPDELFMPKSTK